MPQTNQKTQSKSAEELLELVDEFIFSDPDLALEYAQQALVESRESANTEMEIKALYEIGEIYIRTAKNSQEILSNFKEGIEKSREGEFKKLTAEGHYNLSRYYESTSEYSDALEHIRQALELFKELNLESNVANTQNSLGRIYQELGDFSTALNHLFEALRINEKLQRKTGMAVSYTIIGNTYMRSGRYEEAIRYFNEALALDLEMEDPTGIMISKLNLGAANQRFEDYESAMTFHTEALELARELGYRQDVAIILGNIGSTYRKMGYPEDGLSNLLQALEIMQETGYNTTATLNGIAEAYLDLNDFEQALSYSLQAEKTGKERSDLDRMQYTYRNMADAYEGLGQFEAANRALKLYISTIDSLFAIESEKQINQLQILYETEKRDQTIDQLTLEAENASFRRNTYLASGILVSLFLLLLYSGQRYKARKNRELLETSEEVAQMKSNFFSNISHEFRTPLTLISGPIEQLKSKIDDPTVHKELNIMQKNSDRLLSLINQLLDLSRLESGNLSLSVEKTNLESLVKGVAMSFQSLADMKQIQITVECQITDFEAWVDRNKLETILINLIGNALKFSPENCELSVRLVEFKSADGLNRFRLEVEDCGAGIPEEDLKHIFDRFYRGSEKENSESIGSGIGLALTRELVILHKGEIFVSSKTGEGTRFTVELPVSEKQYTEQERVVSASFDQPAKPAMTTRKITANTELDSFTSADDSTPLLLIIEDNEDVINYLVGILKDSYRIITAPDGEAGVESALNVIPDLIISDVMMPKMTGYKVAEILKQDDKTSHIPLILLTAKASHEDRIQGLQTHADDYLTKPFRPDELLLRVENLILSRKKMREKYNRKIEIKPDELSAQSMEEAFLLRVVEAIKKHLVDEDFSVDQLAREVGMSRSQLHRKLVALTDLSASEFIRSYRLNLAKDKIENHTGSISEIAYEVGFNSPSYFSKSFREKFGVSPSEFEAGKGK
ncbi:tetratricopeptide repeat protein [Rhodohalobacter sp.]|uniref:tetratricopeptide repeat protein n=1 Tax=Rhodohalobacter sp. TaxID=1974210 RepID=UPI002ACEB84D|nr:tetratricopeptide repeat protein [Rhodohalobacter sp.]MDZ7757170.1 tetratricopeptide repeat protein [Rhodohalobacter sp.]